MNSQATTTDTAYQLVEDYNTTVKNDCNDCFIVSTGAKNKMFTIWRIHQGIFNYHSFIKSLSSDFTKAITEAIEIAKPTGLYIEVERDEVGKRTKANIFTFGKYNGEKLEVVAEKDPRYVLWYINSSIEYSYKHSYGLPSLAVKAIGLQADLIEVVKKENSEKRLEKFGNSQFVGIAGQRINITATIIKQACWDGTFGLTFKCELQDEGGNVIIYKGSKDITEYVAESGCVENHPTGTTIKLSAKVKGHDEYNGVKQTYISHPKF